MGIVGKCRLRICKGEIFIYKVCRRTTNLNTLGVSLVYLIVIICVVVIPFSLEMVGWVWVTVHLEILNEAISIRKVLISIIFNYWPW